MGFREFWARYANLQRRNAEREQQRRWAEARARSQQFRQRARGAH